MKGGTRALGSFHVFSNPQVISAMKRVMPHEMDNNKDKYLGHLLDNRYEILEVIGTGGMAVVYKALCHRLNRHVAVKMLKDDLALDSDFQRRFQTESQAVAMLSHPNIVSVYDVSRTSNPEYIVMELIEGITLKQYMQKRGALSWKEALHFSTQITKALIHAHSRGIIHRDIKPHNIMIVKDGSIKVADFGIARLSKNQTTLTQDALGSVHYISPEQARGELVDERSDIYSAGVVMYEMLTGRLPFEGDSAVSVAIQHISAIAIQPRDLDPEIPAGLEYITMKAMNPELDGRYASADALLADLEDFRKSMSTTVTTLAGAETQVAVAGHENYPANYNSGQYIIHENVEPIGKSGELDKESSERRRIRSNKVSLLSGIFCVSVFIIVLSVFLWNYWLKGIFEEAERITIPSFIGSNYEDIINDDEYKELFSFTVKFAIKQDVEKDIIFDQNPESGRSQMIVDEGIKIELTVSRGEVELIVPDVINVEYRQAKIELENLGFIVEVESMASASVTKDYVVETNPAANETAAGGSTVYIYVSSGPENVEIEMPNLVGMNQDEAKALLENLKLSLGSATPVDSAEKAGIVIWQSVEVGQTLAEHTKVFVQVSTGKAATTPPVTTETQPPSTDAPQTQTPETSVPAPTEPAQQPEEPQNPGEGE